MPRHYDPSPDGPDDPSWGGRNRKHATEGCLFLFVALLMTLFGLALIISQAR